VRKENESSNEEWAGGWGGGVKAGVKEVDDQPYHLGRESGQGVEVCVIRICKGLQRSGWERLGSGGVGAMATCTGQDGKGLGRRVHEENGRAAEPRESNQEKGWNDMERVAASTR
jgi:hypothetical protein